MKTKRDIKLWKRFFSLTYKPDSRLRLSGTEISLMPVELDIKNSTDLQVMINGEEIFTLDASDAHRLGTALLGYSKAWWQRNQDVQRGYSNRKWEETEKALGMDKKK